jgi:hypothetical protein
VSNQRYLVGPKGQGWVLRSGSVPVRWFPTKQQALSFGVRYASAKRPSELLVQGRDGSIEDRRVYEPASAVS